MLNAAFADTLLALPLGAAPNLSAVASLATVASLGIDPLSANAAAQLSASLSADLKASLSADLSANASANANMAAQVAAMAGAQAACTAGLGLNLAGGGLGGLGSLASMLSTIMANLDALAAAFLSLPLDLLFKALDLFKPLSLASLLLGKDLTLPNFNLGDSLSKAADKSKSKSWSPSKSVPYAKDLSKQKDLFESEDFGSAMSGIGPIPSIVDLLLGLLGAIFNGVGISVVQTTPCGPCLLTLPTGCLCPGLTGMGSSTSLMIGSLIDAVADMNSKQIETDEEGINKDENEEDRSDDQMTPEANDTASSESSLAEIGTSETDEESSPEVEQIAGASNDWSLPRQLSKRISGSSWFDQAKRKPLGSEPNASDSASQQEQPQPHDGAPE